MKQLTLDLQPQVQAAVQAVVELGAPSAALKDICRKVIELNEQLDSGWVAETLANSVRRAIYEHLGDDDGGVFVRESRGHYRLSVRIITNSVIRADAWKLTKLLPDESVQCIVTDPPWTVLDRHRAWGTTTRMKQREWFDTRDVDEDMVKQMARVLQTGRHLYLFFPALSADTVDLMANISQWIRNAGLTFKKAIVWNKKSIGMGYCYRYQYELVPYITKGKARRLNNLGVGDVLDHSRVPSKSQVHDCEKPLDLVKTLVTQSTDEGDLVVDLFAGSGVTGQACKDLGREYLMVDVAVEWVEHMTKTLEPDMVLDLVG